MLVPIKTMTFVALGALAMGCSPTDKSQPDAAPSNDSGGDAAAGSIACYIDPQFRCKEYPEATADQLTNLPIECSSDSGVLTSPAKCPTAGFAGKCTMGTGPGREIKRVYVGADVAYEQDFCMNTAMGVWSTTF